MCARRLVGNGLLLAGIMLATHAFAQQATFRFLQDEGARSAFVGGVYSSCLKEQRTATENTTLSTPELGAFCLCYGGALADVMNGAEYEALAAHKHADSFGEKARVASKICATRMNASQQMSEDRRLKVAAENSCLREFRPEDTDFAAAQFRERFCGCYADVVAGAGKEAKSPREATDYCYQRLDSYYRTSP